MRNLLILFLVAFFALAPQTARAEKQERHVLVAAGVGLGELIHAEIGVFATPRVLIELRAGWLIFNPVAGAAFTYSLGRRQVGALPGHGWLLRGELMANPTLGEFRLEERGETIGAYAGLYAGYAFAADGGLYIRGLAGALFGKEAMRQVGPMGPNVTATLGYVF